MEVLKIDVLYASAINGYDAVLLHPTASHQYEIVGYVWDPQYQKMHPMTIEDCWDISNLIPARKKLKELIQWEENKPVLWSIPRGFEKARLPHHRLTFYQPPIVQVSTKVP